MGKRAWIQAGRAGIMAVLAGSCTTVLGVDKDYHLIVDETCDGTAREGCLCVPGAMQACYTGPAGTEGVSICTGGTHTCNPDGRGFGPCVGEVAPGMEDCDAANVDEDCDGQVNESGPSCTCGDGTISNAEECDDGGNTATCNADCTLRACGDGFVNQAAGEQCDDGNVSDGDACSSTCQDQKVLSVAMGVQHTCALLSGGVVKCWGKNQNGQLGLGDIQARGDQAGEMGSALPAVDLGQGAVAVAIASGYYHSCVLLAGGIVKCWGENGVGQLGQGDTLDRGVKMGEMGDKLHGVMLGSGVTAVAIAAGGNHTCAMLSNDTVKCWGSNFGGELGIELQGHRGGKMGEMGDALPVVNLGTGTKATAISVGFGHTCALLIGGTLKCWGLNINGQLGLGDTANRGGSPGQMGDALPAVLLGTGLSVGAANAGELHTCAVLSNAALKCWGDNFYGQLGLKLPGSRGDDVGEMGDALPPVDLGPGVTAAAISCGAHHSCALRSDGKVQCLGVATDAQIGGSQPVDLGTGLTASAVAAAAGGSHTCAIINAHIKCWGGNNFGQLGLGDTAVRGLQQNDMGDALPFVKLFNDQW